MQQTSAKGVRDLVGLIEKSNYLGIVQEIDIWLFYQMIDPKTRISSRE